MLFSWNRWIWITSSPFFYFLSLLLISYFIFIVFFRRLTPSIASGVIIMALGIFALSCLPRFNPYSITMVTIAMELLIIWLFLATMLIQASLDNKVKMISAVDRFGLGSWVTGTALTALLLDQAESTLLGFIILLIILAITVWLFHLFFLLSWLYRYIRKNQRSFVGSNLLLGVISAQSIVLLLAQFFYQASFIWLYEIIIILAVLFYVFALFTLLMHLIYAHKQHFFAYWSSQMTYCYSALAMTGLAVLKIEVFANWIVLLIWWWSFIAFIFVEFLECLRCLLKLKSQGFRKTFLVYHTSQWVRIFSCGAFYAFTVAFYHQHAVDSYLMAYIANYGQYLVAALLSIELLLCLKYLYSRHKEVSLSTSI